MSSVVISGDTSGAITVAAPAVAGTNTITLPAVTGTAVVAGQNSAITAATAQTASGSSVDFTGIPSWVKRITVTLDGISFAAAGVARIRLGTSSGLETTGYTGVVFNYTTTPTISTSALSSSPEGMFAVAGSAAATTVSGVITIVNSEGNKWISTGQVNRVGDSTQAIGNGAITLPSTLDRLSLVATTSTFDAGTINILYE